MRKFLLAAFFLTTACGGRIILAADDAGTSTPPGFEDAGATPTPVPTGSTGSFPECPGLAPKTGSACLTPNQGCAYVDVTANTCASWTCDATSHWVLSTPAGCY